MSHALRIASPLAASALAAFAGSWSWVAGRRGLFPLDQSIVLDGAWRVHSGQVPFVDFVTPHGLLPIGLQATVFRVFGVSFSSYLLTAALLNATAALLALSLVRRLLPASPALAWLAGFLTALWFQPPFGTPYSEQTLFFFGLLGLWLLLAGSDPSPSPGWSPWRSLGAGICLVLAILAKQNAGLLLLPVFAAAFALRWTGPGTVLAALGGAVLAAAVFVTWLVGASDPATFVRVWFEIPSETAESRLFARFPEILSWVVLGRGNLLPRLVFWVCGGVAAWFLIRGRQAHRAPADESLPVAACLCLALILYQNLFTATTNNKPENGYAFAGLILAFAIAVTPAGSSWRGGRLRRRDLAGAVQGVAIATVIAVIAGFGAFSGWSRRVHMIYRHSEFAGRIDAPGWTQLRWGQPMSVDTTDVRIEDLNALISHLRKTEENFFVFPDWTFLYALVGRTSPQPLLWFHRGLTYSALYDRELDEWIVRDLERNRIATVVLETESWARTPSERLAEFPVLTRFIDENFIESKRFGIFRVLERRPPLP